MKKTAERLELMEPVSPEALVPAIGLWPWFVAGGALILLAIAVVFLVIALRKQTRDPNAQRQAAYQDAIGGLDPNGATDPRDAAIRSSLVLRRYLSVAAADPALFETHEEFVSRHDALAAMKPEVRETTAQGFAKLAAMKYGPESPSADPREIMREARQLLDTLHRGFAA